jgi:hypothetical protein
MRNEVRCELIKGNPRTWGKAKPMPPCLEKQAFSTATPEQHELLSKERDQKALIVESSDIVFNAFHF